MYTVVVRARDAQQADSAARLIINQAPHNNKSEKSQTALREWNFFRENLSSCERASRERLTRWSLRAYRVSVCVCVVCKVGVKCCFWCCRRQLGNSRCHAPGVDSQKILYVGQNSHFHSDACARGAISTAPSCAIKQALLLFYLNSTCVSENNKV
jgi:hypothetical protein